MSSKEKEQKPFQEKIMKHFFRMINKGGVTNQRSKNDFILTEEIERDISSDSPFNTRQRVIKELGEEVAKNKLEDKGIEKLWSCLQDLIQSDQPKESRHLVFWFLQRLLQGQFDHLGIMRAHFFRVIKQHDHPEDTNERFELLNILTVNGKDLFYFEEEVGPFLLSWMPNVSMAGKIQDFLTLLVNVIKFNAAYIDEEVLNGLVQNTCALSTSNQQIIVLNCLQVLETIVGYSNLPTDSLTTFIAALCRTVNHEEYCQISWKIMRNLLGTHMGHSALYTMCRVLQEPTCHQDHLLLRGAVFHINQALWGMRPLTSLCCTPTSVLPSFLHALHCDHTIVIYEVMLSVQGLINRFGTELHDPAWDIILDIIEGVIQHVEATNHSSNSPITSHLHETLGSMEKLIENKQFNGSVARLYELIERCAHERPELSVLRLVNYTAESIVPTKHMWLSRLHTLLQRYFRQETRTKVRIRVIEILSNVIKLNRIRYEDELIERIVVPHLQHIATDPDVIVRNSCAELLVDLCLDCDTQSCSEILDIIDKILNRPFDQQATDLQALNDAELTDVKTVVSGLIKVFTVKLHRLPSTHFTRVYRMLVTHLENHYVKPVLFETSSHIRYKIFNCFLKIRANSSYHLGCMDATGKMRYSPYLCVLGRTASTGTGSPPPASPAVTQQSSTHQAGQITHVSLRYAFKIFITCLREEKDWDVLHLVLQEIPHVMQNKALVLSKQGNNEIDHLALALCNMLSDKSLGLPESLRNASKIPRAEFHSSVLLVLASLASYHAHLETACQQRIVRCMVRFGLMPRCCSQNCITALTTCTLEMQDVMVKLLPEVLLDLSKISTTPPIAIPVLEFLSTLTHLPMVFGNFVGDQYMAVFAIALPYTNPFKFNHYTVSLAHHVIAVWFLKCRLPFRKDFVRFITAGLQTNAITPFEETAIMKTDMFLNEDSSNRKRSSSLTEQGSRRRDRPNLDLRGVHSGVDRALQTFYEEITETAIDLMARYTFSPCSALPKRLPSAEFLLLGGQSMTWLLGNKVITVTTSGCSQKALKQGLCDKCLALCRDCYRTPDTSSVASRQNSSEHQPSNSNTSASSPTDEIKKPHEKLDQLPAKLYQLDKSSCCCWCQGWAEVHVRRPTGDMSWIMRIQNTINQQNDFPLNDISNLFMPSLIPESKESLHTQDTSENTDRQIDSPSHNSPSRQSSRDSVEDECDLLYEDGTRSRNPVRRTNSSPEMSASWKNPFMSGDSKSDEDGQNKKNKNYTKDMRVSCEAIPEEISGAGTTPPNHPSLLTCRSYPGPEPVETSDSSILISNASSSTSTLPQEIKVTNLSVNIGPQLASKPPQSPTQTSPRLSRNQSMDRNLALNLSAAREKSKQESSRLKLSQLDSSIPPIRRDRGHTISVMSPVSKPKLETVRRNTTSGPRPAKDTPKSGINPSFVFLQLYHTAYFGNGAEKPLLIGSTPIVQRALKILDRIPPYETHKVGVIYVGPGQCNNETEILKNGFGSVRYMEFLSKLGTLISLQDADPQTYFLGGLEQNGHDGKFAYIWQDDVMQVIFHIATLMPYKESDPSCNNKKLHIGNNFVTIVYNESGEEYNISTIKGQFNYANVIIQPLDHNTNRVVVKAKEEVHEYVGHNEPKIISDQNLGILARQLALHANVSIFNHVINKRLTIFFLFPVGIHG